jgi:hypothetical protein
MSKVPQSISIMTLFDYYTSSESAGLTTKSLDQIEAGPTNNGDGNDEIDQTPPGTSSSFGHSESDKASETSPDVESTPESPTQSESKTQQAATTDRMSSPHQEGTTPSATTLVGSPTSSGISTTSAGLANGTTVKNALPSSSRPGAEPSTTSESTTASLTTSTTIASSTTSSPKATTTSEVLSLRFCGFCDVSFKYLHEDPGEVSERLHSKCNFYL